MKMFIKINSVKWISLIVSKIKNIFLTKNKIKLKFKICVVLVSVSLIKKN